MDVVYGNFASPQQITIPDPKTRLFKFEGDGWFPVVDNSATEERLEALEALHKNVTVFDVNPIEAGDNTVVFHWNNTNSGNDITGDAFKVTDDPASATGITQVTIQDGETKRLYVIGSIAAPNVGAVILDVLNTDGVLSYTHVEQRFTDNVDYIAASYNDMDESNPNIGTFSTNEGERVFTLRDVMELSLIHI